MSPLSSVPLERRRRAAATAGLLATLLAAVGIAPWVSSAPGVLRIFSAVALVGAGALALVAWGLLSSVRADVAEAMLDAAAAATIADAGGFDCGHDHDPDEMHVTDCPSEGACAHDCASCLSARLVQ
jgi:hypothetical protein